MAREYITEQDWQKAEQRYGKQRCRLRQPIPIKLSAWPPGSRSQYATDNIVNIMAYGFGAEEARLEWLRDFFGMLESTPTLLRRRKKLQQYVEELPHDN